MKKSKFGLTLALGALLGGLAAFFLTPKTGKENRELAKEKIKEFHTALKTKSKEEIVKEIFGTVSKEGRKLYDVAQKEMNKRLDELKKKYPAIDKTKYMGVVKEVLERLNDEKEATKERLSDLGEFLKSRWEFVAEEGKKDVKKFKAQNSNPKTKK